MRSIEANLPRKQPNQDRSRATVEALLEATTRILEREGASGLSTNRIAEVAGVSVGSLYQYFPNKQSLLAEVRARYERDFMARLVRAVGRISQLSLRQAIPEFVRFIIDIHAESPELHNALAPEIPDDEHGYLQEALRAFLEARRDELRRDDLEMALYIGLQAGESLVHGTALRDPELLEDPRFFEEVCDLLERYFVKP